MGAEGGKLSELREQGHARPLTGFSCTGQPPACAPASCVNLSSLRSPILQFLHRVRFPIFHQTPSRRRPAQGMRGGRQGRGWGAGRLCEESLAKGGGLKRICLGVAMRGPVKGSLHTRRARTRQSLTLSREFLPLRCGSERFSEALPYARKRKEPASRDRDARGRRGRGRGGGHQHRGRAHTGAAEEGEPSKCEAGEEEDAGEKEIDGDGEEAGAVQDVGSGDEGDLADPEVCVCVWYTSACVGQCPRPSCPHASVDVGARVRASASRVNDVGCWSLHVGAHPCLPPDGVRRGCAHTTTFLLAIYHDCIWRESDCSVTCG